MRSLLLGLLATLSAMLPCSQCGAQPVVPSASPYSKWPHGPSTNADFFPLAVWLQNPSNAERYRAAGINTYVALWNGPKEEQLATLRKAGMYLICEQNEVARRSLDNPTIIGWMHGDEPDNAQELPGGGGYGPPILPEKIVESFGRLHAADPSRPVMLNLGQGVAWDEWYGRGSRKNHPEDYPKYIEGSDIVSFDIYPVVHDNKQIVGRLDYVARGVERLVQWTKGRQVVWNCIECTHISNPDRKPTPHEVRAEVWMSLIHGSQGLIYFVHQFKPVFREAALLDDPEMLAAVSALNHQIIQLAPVLNSPSLRDELVVKQEDPGESIATMVKRRTGSTYVFAVEMRGQPCSAEFALKDLNGERSVEVLGENRSLSISDGHFHDHFDPWDVHLYRLGN